MDRHTIGRFGLLLGLAVLMVGCTSAGSVSRTQSVRETDLPLQVTSTPQRRELPPGWHQVLPYDGIRPIYEPEFSHPDEIIINDDELVMGVAWEGEAKAYPVTELRIREMVNDEMAGVPYLVSW